MFNAWGNTGWFQQGATMTPDKILEAIEGALEALIITDEAFEYEKDAANNLRAAIEEYKRLTRDAEPVAWMWEFEHDDGAAFSTKEPTISIRDGVNYQPLFLHPPLTQQVPEWQPIETAPKDGTVIICKAFRRLTTEQAREVVWNGKVWVSWGGSRLDGPTHWMPLPSAPKTEGLSNEEPKNEEVSCNPHPDAPHGFDRNGSHNAGRYVCDCEGWEPPSETLDMDWLWEKRELTAAQSRIRELVEAVVQAQTVKNGLIKWRQSQWPNTDQKDVIDREFPLLTKALSRTDNMEALEAYRNSVIEECINVFLRERHNVEAAIRALKKEKV